MISVFTATHEIGADIDTAFRSLLRQTYANWEWIVVDDSKTSATADYIARLFDNESAAGRVRFFRQLPPPGSVGASKAAAGALCRGDFMVELDHDDELTPDALEIVAATFLAHPEIDFVYSDWVDFVEDPPPGQASELYGSSWAFGYGAYGMEIVDGRRVPVALAAPINWQTMRHIVSVPNHLRAWRTVFYREIGGHDHRLSVADDYELLIRTFLRGKMAHIPRPLYIQHHRPGGSNTSRERNADIQRFVGELAGRYQPALDRRCSELGLTPPGPASGEPLILVPSAEARIDVIAEASAELGMPLVSVVVPVGESADLLRRAVESVLGQTYGNIEVLVVGGGDRLIDEELRGLDDPRLRYWTLDGQREDARLATRTYVLQRMARGTLIASFDDGTRWESNHLELMVSALPVKQDPPSPAATDARQSRRSQRPADTGKVRLVSATELDEDAFWRCSLLGTSLRRIPDSLRPALSIHYTNAGPRARGLPDIYNDEIEQSDHDDILIFVHDDVYLHDWFTVQRAREAVKQFDIAGVAGSENPDLDQPAWAIAFSGDLTPTGWQPDLRGSGAVNHFDYGNPAPAVFGPVPRDCELLDGVLLMVRVGPLREKGIRFDKRFSFHLYDLDFCRTARRSGLSLGTWPLSISHGSIGEFESEAFRVAAAAYLDKWSAYSSEHRTQSSESLGEQ